MRYFDLNNEFVTSIQKGTLVEFQKKLNQMLATGTNSYLAWLFIARVYEAQGDITQSANSYAHLIRSVVSHSTNLDVLLLEIRGFIQKHNNFELQKVAEARFGVGCLKLPTTYETISKPVSESDQSKKIQTAVEKKARSQDKPAKGITSSKNVEPTTPPADTAKNNTMHVLKDSQVTVHSPSQEIIKTKNILELLFKASRASQEGDLEIALQLCEQAYQLGDKSSQTLSLLSSTLQRLKRFPEALEYIEEGIKVVPGDQQLAFLNAKAQVYSAQQKNLLAIEAYDELLRVEKRPAVQRFSRIQQALLYRRLGDIEKARQIVDEVLRKHPQDQQAINLRSALEHVAVPITTDTEADTAEGIELRMEIDLGEGEEIAIFSPMLRSDLASAKFRDEKILLQGGHPEVEDADRLLNEAEKARSSEFGERYPDYLEAAKAYNELPKGTYYETDRFNRALARYAMLKGGALVSELRRRIYSNQINLIELNRLRDSASSYYLESLSLQVRLDPKFALIPLTNLLRARTACVLLSIGEQVPSDLFQHGFEWLLSYCNDHPNNDVARVAYESVLALGSASGYVWNRLLQQKGGPGRLFNLLDSQKARVRPYQIISDLINQPLDSRQKPAQLLKEIFLRRRAMLKETLSFFSIQQQKQFGIENFSSLMQTWQRFPNPGVLSDTDRELLNGVNAVIATLTPYLTRSPDERTSILFTARTNVEMLLNLIRDNPTYWGRVGFEPLLSRWQVAIRSIEQKRLGDILPRLFTRIEPEVFFRKGNGIESSIIIQNKGRATAEGAVIVVKLLSNTSHETVKEVTFNLREEIPAGGTCFHKLIFSVNDLTDGVEQPYTILIQSAPVYHLNTLEIEEQQFTFEVASGDGMTVESILWNEDIIPPEHMFKGRRQLIERLHKHLESPQRNKTNILFGLTRTGKSSILRYLAKQIDLCPLMIKGDEYRFITFNWHLGTAGAENSAADMWAYLLEETIIGRVHSLIHEGKLLPQDLPTVKHPGKPRFRDWEPILEYLHQRRLYPVFLLDEFSYFRNLVDSKRLDATFLAAIREFALNGKASFIFAGTYDLRELVKDPTYGITGQLVNTIETRVSYIDRQPAIELIQAMQPKLSFTNEAIEHILRLSFCIPYFIQLICRYCGLYAVNTKRAILGFPEVENVVLALTGDESTSQQLGIPPTAPGVFMNNMQTPQDPSEFSALLSTICYLTPNVLQPRKVSYDEICALWDKHKVPFFRNLIANATNVLKDRQVLLESTDENIPAYQISVDFFRRWWMNEHRNIQLELDALKQEIP